MKKSITFIVLPLILILCLTGCTKNVKDKEITLELSFGSRTGTYTGTLTDNLPNGKGKFTTQNSQGVTWTYEGDWVEGHMSGEGKQTWEDGREQEGTYANDELNGFSKWHNTTYAYEGEYKDGLRHGQGKIYRLDSNASYEGTFKDGIPEQNEFIQKSEMLPFSAYSKRPQDYYLKPIALVGKITYIHIDGEYSISLVLDGYKEVIVTDSRVERQQEFFEDDIIGVYGFLTGIDSAHHDPSFEAFTIIDMLHRN